MAEYSGKTGDVVLSGGYTSHVTSWTCAESLDIVDASSTDHTRKVNLDTQSDARGTWTCRCDDATQLVGVGTSGTACFYGKTGDADTMISGGVVVTGANTSNPHDGPAEVTYDWAAYNGSPIYHGSTTTTTTTTTTSA